MYNVGIGIIINWLYCVRQVYSTFHLWEQRDPWLIRNSPVANPSLRTGHHHHHPLITSVESLWARHCAFYVSSHLIFINMPRTEIVLSYSLVR